MKTILGLWVALVVLASYSPVELTIVIFRYRQKWQEVVFFWWGEILVIWVGWLGLVLIGSLAVWWTARRR